MSASQNEIKRWALDVSEWFWGTAQGAFNEKQTTSQIIVDAVIGMVPLVGDVTAVRDLIAVGTRLAEDPEKREDVAEWVLLVILLFALIPIIGGVIKGVGRLLLKAGKNAADNHILLAEIVGFLNRIGHGNALKWFKSLDLLKYQSELIAKFTAFADKLIEALVTMRERLGWFLSKDMRAAITHWIDSFKALKPFGAKMIPQALKELNAKLKLVQQAIYKAEWHTVSPGVQNTTYEVEARLVESRRQVPAPKRDGFPNNNFYDFHPKEGWPSLRKSDIQAFSGPITPILLRGPIKIYRVVDSKKPNKAGKWWATELPSNGRHWREKWAVLDSFNSNGLYVEYTIPAGKEIKAWEGLAAQQISEDLGQSLPGGGKQLYFEFDAEIKKEISALGLKPTGWTDLSGIGYGDSKQIGSAIFLERAEIESKKPDAKR